MSAFVNRLLCSALTLAFASPMATASEKYIYNNTKDRVTVTTTVHNGITTITLDHGMHVEKPEQKLLEIRFYFKSGRELLYPESFGINKNSLFIINNEQVTRLD